eukprot:jgi/Mesvir1/16254/Mv08502-RA.1
MYEIVPATLTTMELFDRLSEEDSGVVRSNGSIKKCMDQEVDGFMVSDELREMLLCEDSEKFCMYSQTERSEFLFRIFIHLALGGSMNQFEDDAEPYLATAKRIYKDLLSVQKNQESGKLEVASTVYRISAVEADGWKLFPAESRQNFCYLVVDSLKRHVAVWYFAYIPYW